MTLQRLYIQHLRNLNAVDIQPSNRVNLIYGLNGSGKTSLLEAINVLALGRSFRSHKHKPLINNQKQDFTVFGKVIVDDGTEVPIGIQRTLAGDVQLKANGNPVNSIADLAIYLPVQVINSDTFLLLEGGPKIRRQFMDWLVFHVEHQFYPCWKSLQRCLKHRNSLLRRDRIDPFELSTWDQELVQLTERIHLFRQSCVEQFIPVFQQLLTEFITLEDIGISYQRGWDKHKQYAQVLEEGFERDKRFGLTHAGSHRAELMITVASQDAAEILSRGQQKLLVCALKIAQGLVFSQLTGRKCIYLVDDLPAELDEHHRNLLTNWLDKMDTQVFITGVEQDVLKSSWKDKPEIPLKMFHVKHGEVSLT